MSDLVSRVLAAIEQAERLAKAATQAPWRAIGLHEMAKGCRCGSCDKDEPWAWTIDVIDGPDNGECFYPLHFGEGDAKHIARNDPAAVLRRCAADRELVEKYREIEAESDRVIGRGYAEPDEMVSERLAFEWVVKNRAASYGISVEEETTGE